MKITVADDRPPLVPILTVGLIAGVVAVLATAALGAAGMGASGLRSLLGIGAGLLVGLLLKDRFVAVYEAKRAVDDAPEGDSAP